MHENIETAVDQILQGNHNLLQSRKFNPIGKTEIKFYNTTSFNLINSDFFITTNKKWKDNIHFIENLDNSLINNSNFYINPKQKLLNESHNNNLLQFINIYIYKINLTQIKNLIKFFNFPINITRKIDQADVILGLRINLKTNYYIKEIAKAKKINVQTISSYSLQHMSRALYTIVCSKYNSSYIIDKPLLLDIVSYENKNDALEEVRLAIEKIVIIYKKPVELLSRLALVRKIQHQLIQHYKLKARSIGEEPYRRLRILPP
uniref:R3H domain-containing protein n=1 Tax=Compsopogon caeruleus TaxID=31354 RepID=A0A1Z1XB73_9RHOD|nr:hypothetical protein [Compsopogon caeruleus]ARX96105.1 hypothetical protein [Compsopogon caeruleus]